MFFLIGVVLLIGFVTFGYLYVKVRLRNILDKAGFVGMNLKDIIEEARIQDQNEPKSLSSMDRIYLEQMKKDFPTLNVNELKRESEKVILDCFNGVEKKDSSKFKGKIKSFVEDMMNDYKDQEVHFDQFKFHNTVLSSYKKDKGMATVYFSSSFEYYLNINGNSVKTQDRAKVEFIYIIDENEVEVSSKVLGLHCPNCGSPITTLGEKSCSYCGTAVYELIKKVFTCNDIKRY